MRLTNRAHAFTSDGVVVPIVEFKAIDVPVPGIAGTAAVTCNLQEAQSIWKNLRRGLW
jgi:hypothetical protein